MKQEDKQFLAELAKELNTQDNAATKNPVWCIMDKDTVIVPEGCGDFKIVTGDERTILLEDFAEEIAEQVPEELEQEVREAVCQCSDTDELKDILEEYSYEGSFDFCMYDASKEEHICRDATAFITKKSAEEHLRLNAHHYTKEARAYALCAWRNPVYERLINIIKTTNWEEV